MSAEAMIQTAEHSLGLTGRPNYITNEYADREGKEYRNAPWCDEGITYFARHSSNYDAVCFGEDFAYTVAHAQRFADAGQWTYGTDGISRGDIVFYDWDGSRDIAAIDHVELVTGTGGGYVYTIGCNTNNSCARRVRSTATIVGYGRPDYTTPTPTPAPTEEDPMPFSEQDIRRFIREETTAATSTIDARNGNAYAIYWWLPFFLKGEVPQAAIDQHLPWVQLIPQVHALLQQLPPALLSQFEALAEAALKDSTLHVQVDVTAPTAPAPTTTA